MPFKYEESEKGAVIAALEAAGAGDAAPWLKDIETTVTHYARVRGHDHRLVSGDSRGRAEKIGKLAHQLRNELDQADREALIYALCWDGRADTYQGARERISALDALLSDFTDLSGPKATSKGGRPPKQLLRLTILQLADIYHAATGKVIDTEISGGSQPVYSGFFYPFLAACLLPLEGVTKDQLGNTAKDLKKVYEPRP